MYIAPSEGWIRNPYMRVNLSTLGASLIERVPAVLIRARMPGTPSPAREDSSVRSIGILDTGASGIVFPLWALFQIGITADERSKFKMLSATGWTEAYRVKIGPEVFYDDAWFDLGFISVVSPDTDVSRDSKHGLPIMLGRRDFFNKFHFILNEPRKEAWLRRIA